MLQERARNRAEGGEKGTSQKYTRYKRYIIITMTDAASCISSAIILPFGFTAHSLTMETWRKMAD